MANRQSGWLLAIATVLCVHAAGQAAAQPTGRLIGTLERHVVREGETLLTIARSYDLGFVQLRAANPGVDAWVPRVGLELTVPTLHLLPDPPRRGILINLAEQRMYFLHKSGQVITHPIGTAKGGWKTPVGNTRIVRKRKNPTWTPPRSIRAERPELPASIPPGPDNPLGAFALDLGWRGYVIHGTNRPDGVGRRVSHGCIRLYPEDISALFHQVPIRTPVKVIDQRVKLAWVHGELYLEVHPTPEQIDEIEATGRFAQTADDLDLDWRVAQAAGINSSRLDWDLIYRVARERKGIPVRVTLPLTEPEALDTQEIPVDASASPVDSSQTPADPFEIPLDASEIRVDSPEIPVESSDIRIDAPKVPVDGYLRNDRR
ncbi:MAG: L,D-transpeptidase family protein [Alphaproteobacteria bacterium]|nr:L,D-transpeptidase family protein [Alphaproteobacteria bacterium]